MRLRIVQAPVVVSAILTIAYLSPPLQGQARRSLITGNIDESRLVTLAGNTRPEANAGNDRGRVNDDKVLPHLQLVLRRSPELEQAAKDFVDALNDPNSPSYHQWLTTEQIEERFGAADEDIAAINTWLQGKGAVIEKVLPAKFAIEFSATAGQIRAAFHTEIHKLQVSNESHYANMSDPRIPSALAGVVAGVVALHDFLPHPLFVQPAETPDFYSSSTLSYVTPSDLNVIYNISPVFQAGYTGLSQTIYVAEAGDAYSLNDWSVFRKVFGLSRTYTHGTLKQIHPSNAAACTDPGVNGAQAEVALDMEYASAAAPDAAIVISACSSLLAAVENPILDSNTPATVMSISYGAAEAALGAASNLIWATTYQTGAMKGWSIFVSSGDEGGSVDQNVAAATHGIGVSGYTSTPYNTSVGGTDFATTYLGNASSYWNTTNTVTGGNARSYVPEVPWNLSCASQLVATNRGFSALSGPTSYCNYLYATTPTSTRITTGSGSGGPSGCATGAASISRVVSGTCAGYPKPSWQVAYGVPNDGVRDIPDISLFASNGGWGYVYPACWSNTTSTGKVCTGAVNTWVGFGGTSISSPIMAGIQALINQRLGGPQGLINARLYALANAEYGVSGNSSCDSTKGNAVASNCIFYDVTLGDIAVDCTGTYNCYFGGSPASSTNFYGILSTSSTSNSPAFAATVGYDYATGIGTVNAYNLVMNFGTPPAALSAQARDAGTR